MKLKSIFTTGLLIIALSAGAQLAEAKAKKDKSVNPNDAPIVTTWSKIKEMFE